MVFLYFLFGGLEGSGRGYDVEVGWSGIRVR